MGSILLALSSIWHEALDVCCIAEDILIMGQDDSVEKANRSNDLNVLALLKHARDKNLKLNTEKNQFMLSKVTFMGQVISDHGAEPDLSKAKAISDILPLLISRVAW